MKVVLLNPVMRDGTRTLRIGRCQGKVLVGLWPNIEHGYLASLLLADGVDVALVDANHEGLTHEEQLRRVVALRPDVVFVLSITATRRDDVAIGEVLAAALPDTTFVYWGTHATVHPEDYLTRPRHVAIRREVELTGRELVRALRDGAHTFEDVAGTSYLDAGSVRHAPDRPFLADLDTLPFPSHTLMRTGTHRTVNARRPFALLKVSRGCPHRCVFCTAQCFHGAKWRPRSTESIVEELRHVHATTGVTEFFLQSDVFSRGREWTLALCEGIRASGLPVRWFCNSRVDTLDDEVIAAMARSGCWLVALGVESGSDRVLTAIRKGATADDGRRTLAALHRAGIRTLTYWVFGLPGETSETIAETLAYVAETRPDYAHFYTPTALPGSTLYDDYDVRARVAEGMPLEDFFQGVSLAFLTPGVTGAEVERALYRAALSFYGDPRRILRELANLRNLDDVAGRAATLYLMVRNYLVKR